MSTNRASGFTLVEMLVVIAVIAVITGIAAPAYLDAMARSRQTQCISNLKQLGMALAMYGQDNEGFLPPYSNELPEDWPDWRDQESGGWTHRGYPDYRLLYAALNPYVKSHDVWFCPNDPYAGADVLRWNVRHLRSSYLFLLSIDPPLRVIGDIKRKSSDVILPPSEEVIIMDPNIFTRSIAGATLPWNRGRGCEHFKGTNMLYLDGHTRFRR